MKPDKKNDRTKKNQNLQLDIPHLGWVIGQEMKKQNCSVRQLADQLHVTSAMVYYLLKKKHLNTEMVFKISIALERNFFELFEICSDNTDSPNEAQQKIDRLEEQLAACQAKLATTQQALNERNAERPLLIRMIDMMEVSLKALTGKEL